MKVSLLTATQNVEKTMPFVFYRWLVFLALAFGFVFAALAGAGTAIAMFSLSANPMLFANLGAVVGFLAFGWLLRHFWGSVETAVVTPHLLLLGKVVKGELIPAGKAQLQFAKQITDECLPVTVQPRQLNAKVKATLHSLPRLVGVSIVPPVHPKLTPFIAWLTASISRANADAVFARVGNTREPGPWRIAQLGIVRQAHDLKTYVTQRGYVALVMLIGWIVAYAVLLIPCLKIAAALPFPTSFWPYVVAAVLSWNLKASFLDPIAQAAMIRFDQEMDRTEPGPALATGLMESIPEFREIASGADARG
ncbi:hypothetical protein EWI61_09610 [Methylolobus aquaticus]|nr:hypothetical protein EWI61_09610 [Methylolobus aquaticus]